MRRLNMAEVLGTGSYSLSDIRPGATAIDQARIVVETLAGRSHRALADLVAVNAATLIFLGTSQHTLPEAFALAREVLDGGAGLARLRDLARLSGGTDEAVRRWL